MWKLPKYNVLMPLSVLIWSVANRLALAQSACTLNGQPVPCEELGRQVKGFLGLGLGIMLVVFLVGIAATVFWIYMLVHAATHPIESKALWIILIVLTGILGALIYYFAVKRKFTVSPPPAAGPTTVA